MTTDHDKLRELAEAHVGVSDVELAPDVILSLLARLDRAERERDEERHLATLRGEMLTKCERERDEARAERDARPEITAEDAASALAASGQFADPDNVMDEWAPVLAALRAHAAKAKVTR